MRHRREQLFRICLDVSIHAPREGCDVDSEERTVVVDGFNSRTPGGVRHKGGVGKTTTSVFQFTHPGRGATRSRGATPSPRCMFQFTHPGRGATLKKAVRHLYDNVSIHAPREGCDDATTTTIQPLTEFQFTHPGRGATHSSERLGYLPTFQFTHPGRGATRAESVLRVAR